MRDKSAGGSMLRRRICALGGMLAAWGLTSARPASAEVRYTITNVGTLGGASSSFAEAINDAGQVVGHMNGPVFLWQNGTMTNLGFTGLPFDINNSTQIVGARYTPDLRGFLWEDGHITTLPTFGGWHSSAIGVKDSGQVVGWADNAVQQERAFLWEAGVMTNLGTFGGPESWAAGINESGQIVGRADTNVVPPGGLPIPRAFLYDTGAMIPIAGDYSEARDINDVGQAVGTDPQGAFLWDDGALVHLDASGAYSEGRALNNLGQVVGVSYATEFEGTAFLWESSVMYDLSDLIPPDSGWAYLQEAADINDAGQIIGWGLLKTGERRGFVLTPVPEPTTLWIMIGAGCILLVRRRRTDPAKR
jgi:probable HAF family extracellular repeat protein